MGVHYKQSIYAKDQSGNHPQKQTVNKTCVVKRTQVYSYNNRINTLGVDKNNTVLYIRSRATIDVCSNVIDFIVYHDNLLFFLPPLFLTCSSMK